MATVSEVTKIRNPRHSKVNRRAMKANRKRRKMSPKQIRFFGTKRQRAALKQKRSAARNPKRTVRANRKRSNAKANPPNKFNPAWIVTLAPGAVNPHKKRSNTVAAKTNRKRRRNTAAKVNRKRSNRRATNRVRHIHHYHERKRRRNAPKANRRRRRRNSPVVIMSPRHNRRSNRRRRNPTELFGDPLFGKQALKLVGGGILGVTATKFFPTILPTSLIGGIASSNIGRTVVSGISAVVAGWAGSKVDPAIGQGMLFGGLMQTLSVALNAFLPSVYQQLNLGLGYLAPGSFPVPQNPVMAGYNAAQLAAPASVSGLGASQRLRSAFMPAF